VRLAELETLLVEAWRLTAPRRLTQEFDRSTGGGSPAER
jgi:hypothetical protein